MNYFDLHCDTLTECLANKTSLYENHQHLSIRRGAAYAPWFQCFAVWIPDEVRGEAAVRRFTEAADLLDREIAAHPKRMRKCVSREDFLKAEEEGQCGAVLTIEGGAALGGSLENLRAFRQRGLRAVTLTWNGCCELGDGCGTAHASGLSAFGRAAVQEMHRLGVVPDLSHASDALFFDTAACTDGPLIATHSNSRRVCAHPRNLTDEQFLEICRRGGLVGLNFCPLFLREGGENAGADDLLRHAEHFLSLGGEDILCMGSDFDGTDLPQGIRGIESIEPLAERFLRGGYSEAIVQKLFYGNARAFFISL